MPCKQVKPVSVNLLLQLTKQIRNLQQESISAQNKMRWFSETLFGQLLWFYATAKAARFLVFQLSQLKRFCRCLRSHSFCKSSWHDSDPGVGNQWFEPIWPTVGSYGLGLAFFYFLSIPSCISMICGKWVALISFQLSMACILGSESPSNTSAMRSWFQLPNLDMISSLKQPFNYSISTSNDHQIKVMSLVSPQQQWKVKLKFGILKPEKYVNILVAMSLCKRIWKLRGSEPRCLPETGGIYLQTNSAEYEQTKIIGLCMVLGPHWNIVYIRTRDFWCRIICSNKVQQWCPWQI